ncbi:MAG: MoxR-like ATPase [Actinomycetota bacterium]|jgi:MoxR-like ATPase
MDINRFKTLFDRISDNVNTVIHGKEDVVRLALVAICANGHVLFEDVPGVGKSMLARALAQSMDAGTARIQCTPDMLPGDITGSSIIETKTMNLVFKPGPVFTNILLVDEVNRATPKTQSAMLEAMAERNVSVEGKTHPLPKPFLVLATQNPVELAGTFPLPEAQLDRFLFRLTMGYPSLEAEKLVVRGNAIDLEVEGLTSVCSTKDIQEMILLASQVDVTDPVETYAIEITQATRTDPGLVMGASPRASIALLRASRALAAADGRTVVYPEDIKALLRPVLAHRLMLTSDATLRGETVDTILERVVSKVKPPLGVKASTNGSSVEGDAPKARRRTKVGA